MGDKIGVYKAISAVQSDLAGIGISKDKKNTQQGYSFRGIDDVYDALAPVLAKHGLCILPRVMSREVVERQTKSGGALFYVTVGCEFDLVCAEDGSMHTVMTYGEAMDSGDKATNKAMSAAYKYAAFQTFCIPVDTEDADAVTHDVKSEKKKVIETPPTPKPEPTLLASDTIRKQIEAKIAEAGINRDRFKEWLFSVGMIELKDDKPSLSTLTEKHAKSLVDKWSSAVTKYNTWLANQ